MHTSNQLHIEGNECPNIYITGVDFIDLDDLTVSIQENPRQLTEALIPAIHKIVKDAESALGSSTVILIVLHEYALTNGVAIRNEEKKLLLSALREEVKQYKNLILIPGSFVAHEVATQNKIEKTRSNYMDLNCYDSFRSHQDFVNEYNNFFTLIKSNDNILYGLQNASYVLTSEKKYKHKKSVPSNERHFANETAVFYRIGKDDSIKCISLEEFQILLGLLICAELYETPITLNKLKNDPPLIQAIISAYTSPRIDQFYGASNVHMDSEKGLSIYINTAHFRIKEINKVLGKHYTIFPSGNQFFINEKEVEIKYFHTPINAPHFGEEIQQENQQNFPDKNSDEERFNQNDLNDLMTFLDDNTFDGTELMMACQPENQRTMSTSNDEEENNKLISIEQDIIEELGPFSPTFSQEEQTLMSLSNDEEEDKDQNLKQQTKINNFAFHHYSDSRDTIFSSEKRKEVKHKESRDSRNVYSKKRRMEEDS